MVKQKIQEQELEIPNELLMKFDDDEQLVREFLDQGYTQQELLSSTVTHPTRFDPVCTLEDGQQAGIWLYFDNNHMTNKNIRYTDSRF